MCLRILINLFRKIYSFQFKIEPNVDRCRFILLYLSIYVPIRTNT